jgi:hypothetical protein
LGEQRLWTSVRLPARVYALGNHNAGEMDFMDGHNEDVGTSPVPFSPFPLVSRVETNRRREIPSRNRFCDVVIEFH